MGKVINIVKNTIIIAATIILVGLFICFIMQIRPVIVMSGSMEPTIETGSFLLINENDKDIQENDIIAFKKDSMFIAHRVVGITDSGYITKGDANEVADMGIVKNSSINGTALFWIPKVGYAIKWMSSISGAITIVTAGIVIVLASFLIGREVQNDESE